MIWYNSSTILDPTPIDISNRPELVRIAEEVSKAGVAFLLREDNRDVALLTPVRPPLESVKNRKNKKSFLATAGKLKGIIDPESVIATIFNGRTEGSRAASRPS